MVNKNPMKVIKQWLAIILTALVVVTLFGVIFIRTELVTPSASFFLELLTVMGLTIMMKIWWYNFAEDKRLNEDDIIQEKNKYYIMVDNNIEDSNDLDKYLVILNQENREHYIRNKIGSRTAKNLAKKTWWLCFLHPSYKKLTETEIGQIRYNKLYFKYQRKADKLKPIKSEEIMALSDSEVLYDSKNHLKEKKRIYQISTTIISIILSVFLASMALKEMMLNWENVFRYIAYLCVIVWTIATTIVTAYKTTGELTFDHLNRLKFIIDKYATYKKKEVPINANRNDNDSVSVTIRRESEEFE